MDGFDLLPDPLILQIFTSVSDIKTLLRCRAVSRRFNSLVPQTESLLLRVDCVISSDSGNSSAADGDSFLVLSVLRSIIKSLHDLVSPALLLPPSASPPSAPPQNSPSQILRRFDRVRCLQIELPSGDLRLEKRAVVRWRAEFGRSLRSCAILGFREIGDSSSVAEAGTGSSDEDFARGLKPRVVWTISALIAASARHYLLREVVKEQRELRSLVLKDREGEGTVTMDKDGLAELRSESEFEDSRATDEEEDCEDDDDRAERNRTRVPGVRMRMRHASRLEIGGGLWAEEATLVVVRPTKDDFGSDADDADLAASAFGDGPYAEAVQALLKTRSYILEMNSF